MRWTARTTNKRKVELRGWTYSSQVSSVSLTCCERGITAALLAARSAHCTVSACSTLCLSCLKCFSLLRWLRQQRKVVKASIW